ncbi:hypothetical protein DV515_00010909 [Chloebia gouldiae]|uniref:TATA box-binding protein-like 2 n=1 Tax=Chloebia gouldiae TaxID=44316 RepID=A0A3L8S800_CHLGU|nr:hypothetical protein DV515_00010909 [Chloebia gouldiae]
MVVLISGGCRLGEGWTPQLGIIVTQGTKLYILLVKEYLDLFNSTLPHQIFCQALYLEDDFSTSPHLFTPMSPYDLEFPVQASSLLSQPKELHTDFSSVDLSFLPDVTQDDKEQNLSEDGHETQKELDGSLPSQEDSGVFMDESSCSHPGAAQPSPEAPGVCPSLTPMTPITPATSASESSGIVPQLQNIVSTVNLACKLDLKNIALRARNAEYNPKRFAAVIMRIREPRTTALIFSSGKMVCTGAKRSTDKALAIRNGLCALSLCY